MARLFTTGWELGNDPSNDIPWDADTWGLSTTIDSVTTQKRSPGARSLYINASRYQDSTWCGMTFSALDEFWLRFAFRVHPAQPTSRNYTNSIVQWVDADGDEVGSLRLNGLSHLFSLYAGATLLGTEAAPRSLATFRWNLLELHWKTHASAGIAELKFNGNMKLQLTGQNSAIAGEGQIQEIRFGHILNVSYGPQSYYWWDDCAADDSGWVGDGRVVLLQPDGDGASSDFTGSDGDQVNNYALVDEDVPSITDYVEGTSEGLTDTYSAEDTGGAGIPSNAEILDVEVLAVAGTLDADGYNALNGVMRVGGTDYDKAEQELDGDYKLHRFKFPTNPAIAGAWTPSALDAAEIGIRTETTATTVPPTTTGP